MKKNRVAGQGRRLDPLKLGAMLAWGFGIRLAQQARTLEAWEREVMEIRQIRAELGFEFEFALLTH